MREIDIIIFKILGEIIFGLWDENLVVIGVGIFRYWRESVIVVIGFLFYNNNYIGDNFVLLFF